MKKNWEIRKLGEICNFGNGLWTGKKPPFQKVSVIRNTNFTKDGKLDDTDIVYLDVEQSQFAKRKLQYGDIILEKSGGGPKQPVGRVIIFDKKKGDFSFSNFTSVIRITNPKAVDFTYLHRFLFFSYISGATETMQSHSTGIRNLKFDEFKNIEIPLPPLPMQQHIVSILDEAFASIAKAKANAEQNLKNAKELFESYLQDVFSTKGEGWEEKSLDEIIESNIIGLTKNSREQRSDYKYKYVKMNNITRGNRFDLSKYTCVNATKEEASKYNLSKGDFLFNTRNSYELVGKTCLFEGYDDEVLLYNNNIMRIRFIKTINPYFINYSFTTKSIIKKLNNFKSGTTNVSAIYYKDFKNLPLLIPTLKKQQTIVQKLDALSTETKKLEVIYKKKIEDLEELKKSVLQKAFNGELVGAGFTAAL